MASTDRSRRRSVLRGLAAAAALPLVHTAPVRAQAGPLKLTFGWPFANGTQGIEELAKRFSDEKKTIEVEVQVIPQTQVIPRLTTAFTGGQAPDCMGMSDAWLAQFATPGGSTISTATSRRAASTRRSCPRRWRWHG